MIYRRDITIAVPRFTSDTRGVSALEFTLVLPVLIAIVIGSMELSRAIDNSRKVSLLARTVADLTSQAATTSAITKASMNDILASSRLTVRPFDSSSAKITVSALGLSSKSVGSNPNVCSSFSSTNTVARTAGTTADLTVPPGFRTLGMRFIVVEVRMLYKPLFGTDMMKFLGNINNSFDLQSTVYWPARSGSTFQDSSYSEIVLPDGSPCSIQ